MSVKIFFASFIPALAEQTVSQLAVFGDDENGCLVKHSVLRREKFSHGIRNQLQHLLEYKCDTNTPDYRISMIGESKHCWFDGGVANYTNIPCCKKPGSALHLLSSSEITDAPKCAAVKCSEGKILRAAAWRRYCPTADCPEELCCKSDVEQLPQCEEGKHRQPQECQCGADRPFAACLSSQICKPERHGMCAMGDKNEYFKTVRAANCTATEFGEKCDKCSQSGLSCKGPKSVLGTCNQDGQCIRDGSMSTGLIVTIVLSASAALLLVALGICFCCTRKAEVRPDHNRIGQAHV
eukprot:GEMP01007169.1.p1 GENE.GEMP01007169.1~~GEMP01007169.1.p1  ORF type:complete len:308 (+),score=45.79 GEMP01007169.1:42-926(+)